MKLSTALVLSSLALLVGCGGDDAPDPIDAADLRLSIVSGDGQTAAVASSAAAAPAMVASSSADELLPEPLIVALVDPATGNPITSVASSMAAGDPTAPTLLAAEVPANLLVRFRVLEEGCGEAFIGQALPDSGEVIDRWIKGTLAGDCHMEVARLIDGEPHVDTTFIWHALPGPVTEVLADDGELLNDVLAVGDSVDVVALVTDSMPDGGPLHGVWDEHGNRINDLSALTIGWAVTDRSVRAHEGPLSAPNEGPFAVMPDPEALGLSAGTDGNYSIRLHIWVGGVKSKTAPLTTIAGPGQ